MNPMETIKLDEHAKYLKKKYLSRRYFFGSNSPIDEETQNKVELLKFLHSI